MAHLDRGRLEDKRHRSRWNSWNIRRCSFFHEADEAARANGKARGRRKRRQEKSEGARGGSEFRENNSKMQREGHGILKTDGEKKVWCYVGRSFVPPAPPPPPAAAEEDVWGWKRERERELTWVGLRADELEEDAAADPVGEGVELLGEAVLGVLLAPPPHGHHGPGRHALRVRLRPPRPALLLHRRRRHHHPLHQRAHRRRRPRRPPPTRPLPHPPAPRRLHARETHPRPSPHRRRRSPSPRARRHPPPQQLQRRHRNPLRYRSIRILEHTTLAM